MQLEYRLDKLDGLLEGISEMEDAQVELTGPGVVIELMAEDIQRTVPYSCTDCRLSRTRLNAM